MRVVWQQILTIISPVFLLASIGYLWRRRGMPFDGETIGAIVMNVGAPCLVFSSLYAVELSASAFNAVLLAAVLVLAANILIAAVGLKLSGQSIYTFLPSLIHPNVGNMGLPLCLLAFGETGLGLAVVFYFVLTISQYTLGLGLASGNLSPSNLVRQPVIWAALIALAVRFGDISLPAFVLSTTEIMAGFVIPAMLLMLGSSLATMTTSDLPKNGALALARLGLGIASGMGVIWLLDLEGPVAGVVLVQAAMPSAVFSFVLAERHNRAPEAVATVILVSTLVSFATLPVLMRVALTL